MKDYEDLEPVQQQALVDAFGDPSEYEVPSLRQVDTVEAVEYDNLRDGFGGIQVSQGEMDPERLDSYLGRGILREDEKGNYEINSVWRPQQLEEMKEKGMVNLDDISFYSSETPEAAEIAVLKADNRFKLDIEDSGLTYVLPADTVDSAEYESAEKIQEVTEEFIKFFTGEEPGDTGFMNDSSKPEKTSDGGDKIMADDSTPEPIPTAYDGSHADHEFGELEVDLREEGQRFYQENEGTYSGDEDVEALGAAVLYEQSLEGQDPVDMDALGDYLLEQNLRDDFIDYKADLVDQGLYDTVVQDVEDNVDEIEDIKGDLEREQMFWEAYALEAANERDVAVSALDDVHERAANIDLDTSRLQAAQQARSGLVPREQALNQTREDIRQRSQNEF